MVVAEEGFSQNWLSNEVYTVIVIHGEMKKKIHKEHKKNKMKSKPFH